MEWRKIPGIDFSVSDTGLVRNDNTNKLRKFSVNKGYHYVTLHINGKSKNFAVHRLVAQAFIPNPENKATVNHKNGIHNDNRTSNLEWATFKENNEHKYRVLGFRMSKAGEKVFRAR